MPGIKAAIYDEKTIREIVKKLKIIIEYNGKQVTEWTCGRAVIIEDIANDIIGMLLF